jgi:hypothetical protein
MDDPMPRPVRFSDAPHQRSLLDVCLEPLVYAANVAVACSLYPAWRTARIRWEPDPAQLMRLFKERSRPIMCFAWHAYELNSLCAFRDFPRDVVPVAIGHDGPQSRALQQAAAWFDFPVWAYRRRSPVPPKDQIINLLKAERPVIGVFVDAGGPDGQVRQGFLDVARAAEALLVPLVWHARPALVLRLPHRRYCFPTPFARVTAYHGQPIDGISATPDACRDALRALEVFAEARSSAS